MDSLDAQSPLAKALQSALPEGLSLRYYLISTPPTPCPPLYAAAPGKEDERTYLEKQLLIVTKDAESSLGSALKGHDVPLYSLEVLIYSTCYLTTIFVSKADSTGYLHSQVLPKHAPSVLQTMTSTFIEHLVRVRQRHHRRIVVSLFARSQNTYLFPGSPENPEKRILDDRALVKWWCRVLDPVIRSYVPTRKDGSITPDSSSDNSTAGPRIFSRGSLIVPGFDKKETAAFFPPSTLRDKSDRKRWNVGYPMQYILDNPMAPPRCFIPQFPDDPKTRFLHALDEELPDVPSSQSRRVLDSPSKRGKGMWKSVNTVDQFWEQLAFRQECSSGRIVGFITCVFTPKDVMSPQSLRGLKKRNNDRETTPCPTNEDDADGSIAVRSSQATRFSRTSRDTYFPTLRGQIRPRQPRVKASDGARATEIKSSTRYYICPKSTRGTLVLSDKEYDRVHELLLRLDFANIHVATLSMWKWTTETAVIAGSPDTTWRIDVDGAKHIVTPEERAAQIALALRNKKPQPGSDNKGKRKREQGDADDDETNAAVIQAGVVNILNQGLVRKKPRRASADDEKPSSSRIVTLNSSLIRRKPEEPSADNSLEAIAARPEVRI